MPDDQFIFSSSWLPRPKLELRTLAGYNMLYYVSNSRLSLSIKFVTLRDINKMHNKNFNILLSTGGYLKISDYDLAPNNTLVTEIFTM